MRRVVVVGGPGSGKSTMAATLAERIGAQHVELDELWWGPGWVPTGRLELRERLSERLAVDKWVVDGNFIDQIADLVWTAADAVVWLDPPRHIAIRRGVLRSAGRAVRRTELWNGNRARFQQAEGEADAVGFYEGVLGISHVPKPDHLAARGGCWFADGHLKVHLGVDADFRPATKAHPRLHRRRRAQHCERRRCCRLRRERR